MRIITDKREDICMKKALLPLISASLVSASLAFSLNANGEELTQEITSGQYCQSDIFKQFKKIEQTEHKRLKFKPSNKLLEFVTSMELMCPWESQRDFNGDKRDDWIGYVQLGSEYQLVAYMSGRQKYQMSVLSHSEKPPKNAFIRWLPTGQLKNFTKKKMPINNLTFALQVSNFEGMTEFYLWDGKAMKSVLTTPQMF